MNATFEALERMHALTEAVLNNLRNNPEVDFNPPCHAGCNHCCQEALLVIEQEVDWILDKFTPQQIEELKPRVQQWLIKAQPGLHWDNGKKFGIKWRFLQNMCPLLKDGKCMAYDRRPIGCHTFFAHKDPDKCAWPHRTKQYFADFQSEDGSPSALDHIQAEFVATQDMVYSDHLGVMLARKLLGLNIRSNAATMYKIEKDKAA